MTSSCHTVQQACARCPARAERGAEAAHRHRARHPKKPRCAPARRGADLTFLKTQILPPASVFLCYSTMQSSCHTGHQRAGQRQRARGPAGARPARQGARGASGALLEYNSPNSKPNRNLISHTLQESKRVPGLASVVDAGSLARGCTSQLESLACHGVRVSPPSPRCRTAPPSSLRTGSARSSMQMPWQVQAAP